MSQIELVYTHRLWLPKRKKKHPLQPYYSKNALTSFALYNLKQDPPALWNSLFWLSLVYAKFTVTFTQPISTTWLPALVENWKSSIFYATCTTPHFNWRVITDCYLPWLYHHPLRWCHLLKSVKLNFNSLKLQRVIPSYYYHVVLFCCKLVDKSIISWVVSNNEHLFLFFLFLCEVLAFSLNQWWKDSKTESSNKPIK